MRLTRRSALGGVTLVVLLVAGVTTASILPSTAASAQASTSTGTATTSASKTTSAAAAAGSHGSTWLYVGVLLGVLLFLGLLYGIDLVWTNRRQDRLLKLAEDKPDSLTEAQRSKLIATVGNGTEGLVRALLALGALLLFAAGLFYLLIKNPTFTASTSTIVQNAMAALVTLLTAIVAFYFGAKAGQANQAADKDQGGGGKAGGSKPEKEK